jgi:hypothetical protein
MRILFIWPNRDTLDVNHHFRRRNYKAMGMVDVPTPRLSISGPDYMPALPIAVISR